MLDRSEKLTIALPISSFLPNLGGMEVGLHNIASRLKALGHRPIVIAPLSHVRQLQPEGWSLPYEVIAFPPKILSNLHTYPKLCFWAFDLFFAHLQRRYKFDVWHVTMGYPIGVAMIHFARGRQDIPYLIRCAGDDIQVSEEIGYGMRRNPVIDQQVRSYFPEAQMLSAISESVADEYRALGVAETQICAIPNGVDLTRFESGSGVEPKSDNFVFLSVGRNHPKKNYNALIQAAARLHKKTDEPFEVVIVGRGVEELQALVDAEQAPVRLISELGREQTQTGQVPAMPGQSLINLYKAADAFVFPSKMETFGIAIVEAMAAGLPVIVGDAPGCRDVAQNGESGMMCIPGDADDIAARMLEMMSDEQLRSSYAQKSLTRAQDFSWDSVVEKYLSEYETLRTELVNIGTPH